MVTKGRLENKETEKRGEGETQTDREAERGREEEVIDLYKSII